MTTANNLLSVPGSALPASRYSAKQTRHHVDFFCDAPRASAVFLAGDFNDWHPSATPMAAGRSVWNCIMDITNICL